MSNHSHRGLVPPRCSVVLHALVIACAAGAAHATTSTEFWFAPPDVTDLEGPPGGEPLYLVVSTGVSGATVTVDQPANGGFAPIVFSMDAYALHRVDLSAFKASLETRPTNTIVNSGLHVSATAPVRAVYEVANNVNMEEFPLRGADALGTEFTIPLQKYAPFVNHTFAAPHQAFASFDIVATQNDTTVAIYSPTPIDGHAALQSFAISLNRGQTYSAAWTGANYQQPSTHPGGAMVLSNKPVAITLKDDAVEGAADCYDLMGDQIVPESALGRDYIATQDANPDEAVILYATRDGTQIFTDGGATPVATLFAGEHYRLPIGYLTASTDDAVFIHASDPVYAVQVGGSTCELGMALLPPIDRGGSRAIDFVRRSMDEYTLHVVAEASAVNMMYLNGNPTAVSPFLFKEVPGTQGAWKSAVIPEAPVTVPVETPLHLESYGGRFFVAAMSRVGSSSSFGYLTDHLADVGMTVSLDALPTQVSEPGADVMYAIAVSNTGNGPVLLSSLTDARIGNLDGRGCSVPRTIPVGVVYQCNFTAAVGGNPGDVIATTVSAQATSLGTALTASDDANVTVQDVPPSFALGVEASRTLVGPGGDPVTFTIHVTNTSVEPLTRADLRRDGASLAGQGDCTVGGAPIAAGATYTCTMTATIGGAQGATRILHFTAAVADDDGGTANASKDVSIVVDTRIFADDFE